MLVCSYDLNNQCNHLSTLPQVLTESAADVDVEVSAVVNIVHQIAIVQSDQRVQVMLLPIRVKHIARYLQTEEVASLMT